MDEGLFLLLPSDSKSRDYFDQLFTATLWDLLLIETNRYAQQKGKPSEVTSMADMKAFAGLTAAMSIRKLPVFQTTEVRTGYLVYHSLYNCVRRIDSFLCGTIYI